MNMEATCIKRPLDSGFFLNAWTYTNLPCLAHRECCTCTCTWRAIGNDLCDKLLFVVEEQDGPDMSICIEV